MAFMDKLKDLTDKSIEKGKTHWDENKDDYKDKAGDYKDKATKLSSSLKDKLSKR